MIFLKSPARIRYFKENGIDVPLPPSPVTTRWGTWMEAAIYYADYFERIEHIIGGLDETESGIISDVKKVVADSKSKLFEDLIYIKTNFSFLPSSITAFERRGSPIAVGMKEMTEIFEKLQVMSNKTFINELNKVIGKNPGFKRIRDVSEIVEGGNLSQENRIAIKSLCKAVDIASLEHAPLSSAEVERIFNQYKNIFRDNRRNFTFENLRTHVLVKCNEALLYGEVKQ